MVLTKHVTDFIEEEIKNHEKNKKLLIDLKEDVANSALGNMDYDDMPKGSGGFYSTTEEAALDIISSRAIMRVQRNIMSIEEAKKELDEEKKHFLRLRYHQCKSREQITMQMNISKSTFYRWRDEIINKIAEKMGFEEQFSIK